jgi:phenylpropionate dioxygenase-like ring-hydroxylating dioxygenase large terminal subunit
MTSLASTAIAPQTPPQPLPAGGPDPSRFDWKEAWHPLFYIKDLNKAEPNRFTLLDQDLVIWWEASSQQWRCFQDQCPHRLAPLSEGRINAQGQLECPYHGWAFSGEGDCEHIPQQVAGAQAETAQRACAKALPVALHQGMLFAYAGKPENAERVPVPSVGPIADEDPNWVIIDTFRDLPYDALTLLENVLDPSHLPYTHHQSVGNRANAGPVELDLLEESKSGFTGIWLEGPRRGKLGTQNTSFVAPGLMWHDLTSKQFGRTLTVVYATPISKGRCRLFARFPFKFSSKLPAFFIKNTPRWFSHIGQNAILEDDQIFLHWQERHLEKAGGSTKVDKAFYLPTKADTFVSALRRWVNGFGADPFPGQALPPGIEDKVQLMERYQSHVQHCSSCAPALKNLQRLRLAVAGLALLAWALATLATSLGWSFGVTAGGILSALVGCAGWYGLGQLEQRFYHGRLTPPRNRPEKPGKG